jgi:hypothetical protein
MCNHVDVAPRYPVEHASIQTAFEGITERSDPLLPVTSFPFFPLDWLASQLGLAADEPVCANPVREPP